MYDNTCMTLYMYKCLRTNKSIKLFHRHGYEDYVKHIQSIPLNPSPEVFGLHVNAGITRNLELTANLFDSMTLIRSAVIVGDAIKQDEILLHMKEDIYERIPELFDIEEAQKRYPITYIESMNTVLVQELERYNDLLAELRNSLTTLEKAIRGLIVMTPLLEVCSIYECTIESLRNICKYKWNLKF